MPSLPCVLSDYLRELIALTGGPSGPIGKQFISDTSIRSDYTENIDPLQEDSYEVAPGMIYKYQGKIRSDGTIEREGRVLWMITRYCASYCRFCTRGRLVGLPTNQSTHGSTLATQPILTHTDITKGIDYIASHPEITEVILSGGDAFVTSKEYLDTIIEELSILQQNNTIHTIRFATRLPITNPRALCDWHSTCIKKIRFPYVLIHCNHPAELTTESLGAIQKLQHAGALILSQSVLLKGVNDSSDTLVELFTTLSRNGIRPYYLFQCEPLPWTKKFIVPIQQAITLWQSIRPRLSGIAATAKFVIDVPNGKGKIVVPEGNFWNVDWTGFRDFDSVYHSIS